jgi:hypothetical protein
MRIFILISIICVSCSLSLLGCSSKEGIEKFEATETLGNNNLVDISNGITGLEKDKSSKSNKQVENINGNANKQLNKIIKNLKLYKDELVDSKNGREEVVIEENVIEGYTYVKSRVKEVKNFEEQVVLSKSDIIFPGAIFRGDTLHVGKYVPINVNRKPIKISTSFQGNIEISDVIDDPRNISNARETINRLLMQDGLEGTADVYFVTDEIYSEDQMALSLGAGVGLKGINVGFDFSPSQRKQTSKLISQFVQRYYSISVDYPNSPADFFSDNVTEEDIVNTCGEYMPVYVSKVIYGRRGLFLIESEYSAEDVKSALNVGYSIAGYTVEGGAEDTDRSVFKKSHIMFHILGGNEETAVGVVDGYDAFLNHIKDGGEYSRDSRGEIIGFELRYLHDNSVAKVVLGSEYDIVKKVPRERTIKYTLDYVEFKTNDSTCNSFWLTDGVIYIDDNGESVWELHNNDLTNYTIIGEKNGRVTINEFVKQWNGYPMNEKYYKSNFNNEFKYNNPDEDKITFNINIKGKYYSGKGRRNTVNYHIEQTIKVIDIGNEEFIFIECTDGSDFSPWKIIFAFKPYITYK